MSAESFAIPQSTPTLQAIIFDKAQSCVDETARAHFGTHEKEMQPEKEPERSDAELFIECKNGSKRAWEALVRRFQRLIYTIPRRAGLSEDQASDVFQIVFSRAFENLQTISQPERIQAWLVTTAKRETLAILRQSRRTVSISQNDDDDESTPFDIEDESPLPEETLEQLQLQRQLRAAVEQLDAKSQAFVKLVFMQDDPLPYSEVAQRLGISEGSIGPTRVRCMEKLRAIMNQNK
jgi:RNA polymerase sigma factor (sigma-70 family)